MAYKEHRPAEKKDEHIDVDLLVDAQDLRTVADQKTAI